MMKSAMLEMRQSTSEQHLSPPYPVTTAGLGLVPTVSVDVPICAVFLVLFLISAVCHMTIFQLNLRRGHKFIMSGMMFGFCMARIVTMAMRIVWATRPTNVRIAIAAQVFVTAGVVLLFVINVVFAQRIIRAGHPRVGWHPSFYYAFVGTYILIILTLIMIIVTVIQSFYTLNSNTKRIDRDILLYGGTFYAFVAFLPFPLVIGCLLIPRKTRLEKFGQGRWRNKIAILLIAAFLLCLGASFRAGTNIMTQRPRNNPAWYHSKACFYIFNFTVEIIVVALYIAVRVDKRFHVPNGSKGPGDYIREKGGEGVVERNIASEEEIFDDLSEEDIARGDNSGETVVEKGFQRHDQSAAPEKSEKSVEPEIQQPAQTHFPDGH